MIERLFAIEQDLRRAAGLQRHEDVARLTVTYCQAAESLVKSFSEGDPRIAGIAGRVQLTLQWALLMTHTARAACAVEIQRLATLNQYVHRLGMPAAPATMRLDV